MYVRAPGKCYKIWRELGISPSIILCMAMEYSLVALHGQTRALEHIPCTHCICIYAHKDENCSSMRAAVVDNSCLYILC